MFECKSILVDLNLRPSQLCIPDTEDATCQGFRIGKFIYGFYALMYIHFRRPTKFMMMRMSGMSGMRMAETTIQIARLLL